MRLILTLLAVAHSRWALADMSRAALLGRQADEALDLARRRMAYAEGLANRALARR